MKLALRYPSFEFGVDVPINKMITARTSNYSGESDNNEIIRLYAEDNEDAKATIAFFPYASTRSKAWIACHDYLHYYDVKTFTSSGVDIDNDTITISSSGYDDGIEVQFTTTDTLPAGLSLLTDYYLNISSSIIKVYDTYANAIAGGVTGLVNLTSGGAGTHTITPDNTYRNNRHQHLSFEVTDSTGNEKQTRFAIPYDLDTTEMGFFSSNVNLNDGSFRINVSSGSAQIQFGNQLSNNRTPDLSNVRWSIRKDDTVESGDNVGSDFRIVNYTDAGAASSTYLFIKRSNGNIGIKGNTSPTEALSIAQGAIRKVIIERATSGVGNRLSVEAGGAQSGGSNLNGGELRLTSGISTGTGSSFVSVYASKEGSSGTTDRTQAEVARFDSARITTKGNYLNIETKTTPALSTSSGTTGDICWDNSYMYLCTASNSWGRVTVSTW